MNSSSPPGPARYKLDAVIGLAALVLLLLLCRLVSHPTLLGVTSSTIVTNIFGPFGVKLAQSLSGHNGDGESADGSNGHQTNLTETSGAETNGHEHHGADSTSANPPNLSGPVLNPPPTRPGSAATDDSGISNRHVESVVSTVDFASDPVGGMDDSTDAPAMARRLDAVGAKGGDIQFSLSWNNINDLDLHCIDPRGVEIWYENTNSTATGGQLDHDANASQYTATPVENIYWPAGGAPAGLYKIFVVDFANHGGEDPTRFTVRAVVKGQTNYFTHAISYTGHQEKNWICTIQYDPANPDPSKRRRFLNQGQPQP